MPSDRFTNVSTTLREGLERIRALVPGQLPEIELASKVVLITGGSRGLGFLLAREFGRQGCRVAICARNQEELDQARHDLQLTGPDEAQRAPLQPDHPVHAEVYAQVCDVSNQEAVDALIRDVTRQLGQIDILVNNAGIMQVGPLSEMTVADFEEAMGVMFWGVLFPTLAVLPQMRARHTGSIVNITSIGGKISAPHLLPYSSAKFAATGLSEGLRAELAHEGIRVTTIAPGLMRTGSYLNAFFKGIQEGEYTWFALGAALPFVSMDAERAAAQIVAATRRGEAERVLSLSAATAARFHGLFPGLTADILSVVNRWLPGESGGSRKRARGVDIDRRIHSDLLDFLTSMGRAAARKFNE